jgi:hypothetical protein
MWSTSSDHQAKTDRLRLFWRGILIMLVIVVAACSAYSSEPSSGAITGTIYDSATGKPLPFANIILLGTSKGATSDSKGRFLISGIPAGAYVVQVSMIGYDSAIMGDVKVEAGLHVPLTIVLAQSPVPLAEFEVVATSQPFQQPPDMPLSAHQMAKEEIRTLGRGLNDPLRALSLLPGVAQTKIDRNDLLVRGGSPAENLIVVDDIEVPTISHFSTQGSSSGSSSLLDLELIESASFSKGGFGVRYGDKLSSVVDLRIRNPRNDRFSLTSSLSTTQLGLHGEGPLPADGAFLLSVRRSYLDIVFRAYDFGFVPEFWDGLLKSTVPLGNSDRLSILAVGAIDYFTFLNNSAIHRNQNSRIMFTNQSCFTGSATWRHILGKGYFTFSGSYTWAEHNYQQSHPSSSASFTSATVEREYSLQGDAVIQLGSTSEFSAGARFRSSQFDGSVSSLFAQPLAGIGQSIPKVSSSLDTVTAKAAVYLQLSQSIGRLSITAGVRADYYDLGANSPAISPRISARLAILTSLNLDASVGRYYQSPSTLWFAANAYNVKLSPLGADHFILGSEYLMGPEILIRMEGYLKRYFHYPASLNRPYLVMANTGAGSTGAMEGFASFGIDSLESKGIGQSRGIEFFIQKKMVNSPWYGILSVSHSATDFTGLDGIRRRSSHDQPWTIGLALGFLIRNNWEFGAKFRYASGGPYTPLDQSIVTAYNSARVNADHSLDLYGSRRWTVGGFTLTAFVNVLNVYNRKPSQPFIFTEEGQREDLPGLGIVPTIGVIVEF